MIRRVVSDNTGTIDPEGTSKICLLQMACVITTAFAHEEEL
jgi:hypothetical protein